MSASPRQVTGIFPGTAYVLHLKHGATPRTRATCAANTPRSLTNLTDADVEHLTTPPCLT